MSDAEPVRVSILATGFSGGRRVSYLLLAVAIVLFGLALFDIVAPDTGGWTSVGLWAGVGVIFLVTADASGLGYTLTLRAPAELTDGGFGAPFFRYADFHPGDHRVVLRSRILRLPIGWATAPNRVDWSRLVVRVGLDGGEPYLELWPLRGAPFRSLIAGVRSTLAARDLPTVAGRAVGGDGDLHVVDGLLSDAGRAAERACPHGFRSDARFGRCLSAPPDAATAASWFLETAPRDPRQASNRPVERPASGDTQP